MPGTTQSPDPGTYQQFEPIYSDAIETRRKRDEQLMKRAEERVRLPLRVKPDPKSIIQIAPFLAEK